MAVLDLDWYELQLWQMRNAGLDSAIWIIGTGPTDFWGPMRYQTACTDHLATVHRVDWAVPMTYRWIRA